MENPIDNLNDEAQRQVISREITEITAQLLNILPDEPMMGIGISMARILAEAGPRQAEVLRRCAIPRWFDADVLAMLRERADGNSQLLVVLQSYSFISVLDDDRLVYQDDVREALLHEWRTTRPDELRQWHERLADYFAQRASTSLPPNEYVNGHTSTAISVALSGDWDLFQRESLYHALHADPHDGMAKLEAAFVQAESAHRLGDAEALLRLARGTSLDVHATLRLRYLQARLDRAALRLDAAEHQLDVLLATPGIDSVLEAQARQTLGEIYAETARWVQATELYHQARAAYETAGNQPAAAETWRLLGAAYQELGSSTGGWHVPTYPNNRVWRALGDFWTWLLSLPFYLTSFILRRSGVPLPKPHYLASYRNWTLVWLYRTAAACYERARSGFAQAQDQVGMMRVERQLADITRIFGYPDEALQQIEAIKLYAVAQDPYRRAWLDWVTAAALIDKHQTVEALALIRGLIERFHQIGDLRHEGAALALQGKAAAQAGDIEGALGIYRSCLERFRDLRLVTLRELVLYDLRVLRRLDNAGKYTTAITNILHAEPEKRYVARFPRSQLPLLTVLSVASLPLALLVFALVAPQESIAHVAQLASFQTTVDLSRALIALLILLVVYSGCYALIATGVIAFVPLGDLDREQPDYFVTDPQGLSRYNSRGIRSQRFAWSDIQRWLRVERRLWQRPVSLVSAAYLESRTGEDMQIDGITGWFLGLQDDVDYHLRTVGSPVKAEHVGVTAFPSIGGASVLAGLALLMLFILSQNVSVEWLIALLPPPVYAALSVLAFSGVLILLPIAYWLGINPLVFRRRLSIRDYYPFGVAVVGVGMIVVGVLGLVPRVPPLNFGLVLTGAPLLAYALSVIVAASSRTVHTALTTLGVVASLAYVSWNILPTFNLIVNRVGADQAVLSVTEPAKASAARTSVEAAQEILADPEATPAARAQAYANAGRALYAVGDYQAAFDAYTQALAIYETLPPGETRDQARAAVLYNRYKTGFASGTEGWSRDRDESCALVPDVGPDCNL